MGRQVCWLLHHRRNRNRCWERDSSLSSRECSRIWRERSLECCSRSTTPSWFICWKIKTRSRARLRGRGRPPGSPGQGRQEVDPRGETVGLAKSWKFVNIAFHLMFDNGVKYCALLILDLDHSLHLYDQ